MIPQVVASAVCMSCRGCCRFAEADSLWAPSLTTDDITCLLKAGAPPALFTAARKVRTVPAGEDAAHVCAFLDCASNACKLYAARPFECALYPFVLMRTPQGDALAVDPQCPYVQEHKGSPAFASFTRALIQELAKPPLRAILRNNRHLFQCYPGVMIVAALDA
jgi:hypothetical protein